MKDRKKFLSIPLALLLAFGFAGCSPEGTGPGGSTEGKKPLPDSEYEDDVGGGEYVDNTPEDPGEKADHIFEAEAAQFVGTSTSGTTLLTPPEPCIASSQFFDLSFSDGVIIRNVTSTSNKYIFEFTSSHAYKATMEIAVASAYTSTWVERELSAMFDIVVNERAIDTDIVVPAGSAEETKGGNNYTCIKKVEVPVSLKEGENIIMFNVLAGVCNLDYINIKTSADLTFEPRWWDDEHTEITLTLPTEQAAGSFLFRCNTHSKTGNFTLPALSDDAGYTVTGEGSDKTYSFRMNGGEYSIKADGTYTVPEGVKVTEPRPVEPPEEDDPLAPPIPSVSVNGKDFFDPANWTTFTAGDPGAKPEVKNGALKFTNAARFDFFYVQGKTKVVHIADKASTVSSEEIYGKDYEWGLTLSATNAFDLILFGTASLPSAYGQSSAAGVYLHFDGNKISVRHASYGAEETTAIAEATQSIVLDASSKVALKFTVNRLSAEEVRLKLTVGETPVVFTATATEAKGATINDDGTLTFTSGFASGGSYGQRLCVVPDLATVRLWELSTPAAGQPDPKPDPKPDPDPKLPSVSINGKDFFDPTKWTVFAQGTEKGEAPAVDGAALKFVKPARFDFFYTDGSTVHLAETPAKLANDARLGKDFSYKLNLSATGGFDLVLFGTANAAPTFEETTSAGVYLRFDGSKITVWNKYGGSNETEAVAEAVAAVPVDGTTFELTITVNRTDKDTLRFSLAVNGTPAAFETLEGAKTTTADNGAVVLALKTDGYGQRLCVVPGTSVVKISGLTLPAAEAPAGELPSVPINGKNFFDPAQWTTFASGNSAKPTVDGNALKLTDPARFDFFYVPGIATHLAEAAGKIKDESWYGKEYEWDLKLSATGSFDLILFGTANLPSAYAKGGANGGVYLTFEAGKISVKTTYYGSETEGVLAEGTAAIPLDGTAFDLSVKVNRVDAHNLRFTISVNGTGVSFAMKDGVEATMTSAPEGAINLAFESNGCGQRIAFVPTADAVIKLYGLTAPTSAQ